MAEDNAATARRAIESGNRMDIDGIMAEYRDDATLLMPSEGPGAGRHDGREAIKRFFEDFYGQWTRFVVDIDELIELEDKVVGVVPGAERAGAESRSPRRGRSSTTSKRGRSAAFRSSPPGNWLSRPPASPSRQTDRDEVHQSLCRLIEIVARGTEIPSPPDELIELVGGGLEIGQGHLAQLREDAALRPDDRVLDIGCGIGRTAIPLTSYLSQDGAYEGFDIWPEAIDWCIKEITPRFPHFHFTQVDLFNAAYNPSGSISPHGFVFPYADEAFDLVLLYSVFTHMLAKDFEHYLSECGRVLKNGGRVLATFFLLNDDSLRALAAAPDALTPEGSRVSRFLLERDFGSFRAGCDVPEWLMAFDESFVREVFRRSGFHLREPILYGTWVDWAVGRASEYRQDTVLAYR
jgi:SAM-dependent methyltransferase/ketosteroid isomerase-like protein